MVEMLDDRSPNNAILSATTPLFFQQIVTGSNLLLYGPAMPSLTPGRRYALMVAAKDPFNSVTFRNNGRSAVTSFIYGDTTGTAASGARRRGDGYRFRQQQYSVCNLEGQADLVLSEIGRDGADGGDQVHATLG